MVSRTWIPPFTSVADADGWLSCNDKERRQFYATGSLVEFDWDVRRKDFDQTVGFAHPRLVPVRCTGKVIAFMPHFKQSSPGYKVVASVLTQEPRIFELSAESIVGLA